MHDLPRHPTGAREGQYSYVLGAGVAALVLANIHTYDALPLDLVMLLWIGHGLHMRQTPPMIWKNGQAALEETEKSDWESAPTARMLWLAPLVVILCASSPVLWQWLVMHNSPEFKMKALTVLPSPPLFDVLLSYGPLTILAAVGVWVTRHDPKACLMLLWVNVTLLLMYVPVSILPFARRMIEGLHLPLCFLAATGLVWMVKRVPQLFMRRVIIVGYLALSCLSTIQFVAWCLTQAQANNVSPKTYTTPFYQAQSDLDALHYLAQYHAAQAGPCVVLCLPSLGNYIPRETGLCVYIGHWLETMDYDRKYTETREFFSGQMSFGRAETLLKQHKICYVLEGTYEKKLQQAHPTTLLTRSLPCLKAIYERHGVSIYEVRFAPHTINIRNGQKLIFLLGLRACPKSSNSPVACSRRRTIAHCGKTSRYYFVPHSAQNLVPGAASVPQPEQASLACRLVPR